MTVHYDSIVIGGGITGLAAAYRLAEQGKRVCLLEGRGPGGVIQSLNKEEYTFELGPNVLMLKPELSGLLNSLNLGDEVVTPANQDYKQMIFHKGGAKVAPSSFSTFLSTELLSLGEKFRALKALGSKVIAEDIDESVDLFFSRLMGSGPTRKILSPILQGIYGGDISRLSARSVFPNLWASAQEKKKLLSVLFKKKRKPGIAVLKGGNVRLIQELADALPEGSIVRERVISVTKKGDKFAVKTAEGSKLRGNSVFIATSGPSTGEYLKTLSPECAEKISEVSYTPLAVLHFSADTLAPPYQNSFGVLFPQEDEGSLLGVMFNSQLFPHVAPTGKEVITVCMGGIGRGGILSEDNESLTELAKSELKDKLGIDVDDCFSVRRWPNAIPQYEVGHYIVEKEMDAVESEHPGLYFIGADRGGIGIADRVRVAEEGVRRAA